MSKERKTVRGTIWARLRNSLIAGFLVILPATVTIWLLIWLFNKAVKPLTDYITGHLPEKIKGLFHPILWNIILFFAFLFLIIIIGALARNIIGRKLIGFGEKILSKIPLVSKIYTTIQQISQAFLGRKRHVFQRVVLFEYPRSGIYSLGFVTSERTEGEVQEKTSKKVLSIFICTTPNPTSGFLIIVPEEETIPLEMSVEDGMKMVISGGAVVPPIKNK